jgi:hypothetical protein
MTVAVVGAGLISAGMAAHSQMDEGEAADAQARRNAAIVEANAKRAAEQKREDAWMARAGAADAVQRGEAATVAPNIQAAHLQSEQRVAGAASGVDVGSGSLVSTMVGSQQMAELDILTTRNNAAREAWGYGQEARSLDTEAKNIEISAKETAENLRKGGEAARAAANTQAFSTFLGGAMTAGTKAYGSYSRYGSATTKGW